MIGIKNFFRASAEDFKKIPGSPVAYWVSREFVDAFEFPSVEMKVLKICKGCFTGNNELYLRLWFEVGFEEIASDKWHKYSKGGRFRRWYGNSDRVILWENNGRVLKSETRAGMGASQYFGKEHFVWSGISTGLASFRYDPNDVFFDDVSPALVFDVEVDCNLLAILNSKPVASFLHVIAPTMHFQAGDIKMIPMCSVSDKRVDVTRLVDLAKKDWDAYEISWDFMVNPLVATRSVSEASDKSAFQLSSLYAAVRARWAKNCEEMRRLETENNRIFIEAYGLQDELTPEVPWHEITLTCNPWYRYGVKEVEKVGGGGDSFPLNPELEARLKADTVKELISYAVGCMMGRYAIDKPGLILADQGSTYGDYLAKVSEPEFDPDEDGIIPVIDEDCFADDIVIQFHKFLRTAFGAANFNANLSFIEEAIGKDLRSYFTKDFYGDHLQRYQKRPIYWLFSSPKGTFSALVYLHRYHPGTVGQVLTYLRSHITNLKSRLDAADRTTADPVATQGMKTKAIKERTKLMRQLKELEDYERDVLHPLASERLEIDLDDGVKVNYPKFGKALRKIPGFE